MNKVGGAQPGLFHFVSLPDSCLLCRRADVSIAQPRRNSIGVQRYSACTGDSYTATKVLGCFFFLSVSSRFLFLGGRC